MRSAGDGCIGLGTQRKLINGPIRREWLPVSCQRRPITETGVVRRMRFQTSSTKDYQRIIDAISYSFALFDLPFRFSFIRSLGRNMISYHTHNGDGSGNGDEGGNVIMVLVGWLAC